MQAPPASHPYRSVIKKLFNLHLLILWMGAETKHDLPCGEDRYSRGICQLSGQPGMFYWGTIGGTILYSVYDLARSFIWKIIFSEEALARSVAVARSLST